MKKLIALILVLIMVLSLAACAGKKDEPAADAPAADAPAADAPAADEPAADEPAADEPVADEPAADEPVYMTHDEYIAAELDSEVLIKTHVQAWQSWWDNKITLYCQDDEGAYFVYEAACTEEQAAQLVYGAEIVIHGYKGEWAGEVEIMDATIEINPDSILVPEVFDATELLGTDELIAHQNEMVLFRGLTIESITYKNDEPGDDIYVTVSYNGASYDFCVERYLTDPDTDVYKAFADLKAGDVVNIAGFLYWYEGVNTHITAVELA